MFIYWPAGVSKFNFKEGGKIVTRIKNGYV